MRCDICCWNLSEITSLDISKIYKSGESGVIDGDVLDVELGDISCSESGLHLLILDGKVVDCEVAAVF